MPEVSKEACFALHGGTAINLFVRNLPRLSVDIDLTYIPIEDRKTSLTAISAALQRIKANIEALLPESKVLHREETAKLQVTNKNAVIKIEVNLVGRGVIDEPLLHTLCPDAQEKFESFCETTLVPFGQLYGGKLCAAVDRQHPRDLFDVKYLLDHEGLTPAIKRGFIYSLLCSARPINELLNPNLIDQEQAMAKQFLGMSLETFSYKDYEATRTLLMKSIHLNLTDEDRGFLISFKMGNPVWDLYNYGQFPAVQWKLLNIQRLKEKQPEKHVEQLHKLKDVLSRGIGE